MAGQPVSNLFFFFKNSSLFCRVLLRVEMQLLNFELLHQTIKTNSGAVAVMEVTKRTPDYSETFRTAAAKKNKQQRRNAGMQHPSTTALLGDCSLFLCDTVILYQLFSHFSFSVSHSFCIPLLLPPLSFWLSAPQLLSPAFQVG